MSAVTGYDPYKIVTYPLESILYPSPASPQIGLVVGKGTSVTAAPTVVNQPISNAVMSGALPFYEKNALNIGTLDWLDAQKRSGQQLNPGVIPAGFNPPVFNWVKPEPEKSNLWVYWAVGGVLGLVVVALFVYFFVLKKRK